jgi:hypothetical protein
LRKATYGKRAGSSTALAMTILVVGSLVGATLLICGDLLSSGDVAIIVRVISNATSSVPKTPPITGKNDTLRDEPDIHPPINVSQFANFTLFVGAPEGSGSNTLGVGSHSYVRWTIVQAEAAPSPNYVFSHWQLDGSRVYSNTVTFVMNTTHYLQPVFTAIQYSLTVRVDGSGSTSPVAGTHMYINGTSVTLNATAAEGWKFNFWTLDEKPYAEDSINLIMTRDYEIKATFTPVVLPAPP